MVTPATKYDVIRILNSFNTKNGGRGLHFHSVGMKYYEYKNSELRDLRGRAKLSYKRLKRKAIENPIFGRIEITAMGWRNMTRESRLSEHKMASYEIVPLLEYILKLSPSKHFIQNYWQEESHSSFYRKVEYLLEYDDITLIGDSSKKNRTKVFLKIVECIKYPMNWKTNSQLSQNVKRRVIFKSIYYKKK